jgi:hypothetical protein
MSRTRCCSCSAIRRQRRKGLRQAAVFDGSHRMTVRAIIFDCDGTLVDSEGLANQVLVDYLGELGHEMWWRTR